MTPRFKVGDKVLVTVFGLPKVDGIIRQVENPGVSPDAPDGCYYRVFHPLGRTRLSLLNCDEIERAFRPVAIEEVL